ncbi:MAG: GNAT family N-acetyltransferase [Peptococcaceae bacterium]|jgi:GNAT superfamily N-acetyltransferase|nr:GNAT family N-acetyltransferase [Peptococcaceae bacterium]
MLTIRNFTLPEMVFPMEVAFKEGWNPGLYDGVAFYQADPDGFFLAEQDGGMVGGISAVNFDDRLIVIGNHFVLPPYRGQGIGKALWERALLVAGDKSIRVNGLPEGRLFYESYGFQELGNIIRYGGSVFAEGRISDDVYSAQDISFSQLTDFDAGFFGISRPGFLRTWLATPAMISLCLLKEGELQGWGCMRRCRNGWRLGPVFAKHYEHAEELVRHFALSTVAENVYMDITDSNVQAIRLAFAMGMTPWEARVKLYRGEYIKEPLDQIFGFTTVDIG